MSANVSLGEPGPGLSAYFDGQPIQDQQEAELRQEEARQDCELRLLLEKELEEFEEDDSLSASDEDSSHIASTSVLSAPGTTSPTPIPHIPTSHITQSHRLGGDITSPNLARNKSLSTPEGLQIGGQILPHVDQRHQTDVRFDPLRTSTESLTQLRPKEHNRLYTQVLDSQHQRNAHSQAPNGIITFTDHPGDDWTDHNTRDSPLTTAASDDWMLQVLSPASASPSHHNMYPQSQHPQPTPHYRTPHPQTQPTQYYVNPHIVPDPPSSVTPLTRGGSQPANPRTLVSDPPALPMSPPPVIPGSAPADLDSDDYVVRYSKPARVSDHPKDEDFFLDSDNIAFFGQSNNGDKNSNNIHVETSRTFDQLQVLYRARGREIEELKQKLNDAEEEAGRSSRSLKHKLALAVGEGESAADGLKQCQMMLNQTRGERDEMEGKVRALEVKASGLLEVKDELIGKLKTAESAVESLTQHVEDLQASDSLARARHDHETVVATLTQRHQAEMLALSEKMDATRQAMDDRCQEVTQLRQKLGEVTSQLEENQMTRGETINRLQRSLEESQAQCQALLEKSSAQELSSLRVQLHQAHASRKMSEDLAHSYQTELKDLKEQLTMFESASALGALTLTVADSHVAAAGCHDDSMADLGIRKTLDFSTPKSAAARPASLASSDELISQLKLELERCLISNKQKRSEVMERSQEVKALKSELNVIEVKCHDLEKTCEEQKRRLGELDRLTSVSGNCSAVEARLKQEMDSLKRENSALIQDSEDYKRRISELATSETQLSETAKDLGRQVAQMVTEADEDKRQAIERCQRTMEEVHRMSKESLRVELEEKFTGERQALESQHKHACHVLRQELAAVQAELDKVKAVYVTACQEAAAQEVELKRSFEQQRTMEVEKMNKEFEAEREEWKNRVKVEVKEKEEKMREEIMEEFKEREKSIRDEIEASGQKNNRNTESEIKDLPTNLLKQREQEISALTLENEELMKRVQVAQDGMEQAERKLKMNEEEQNRKKLEEDDTAPEVELDLTDVAIAAEIDRVRGELKEEFGKKEAELIAELHKTKVEFENKKAEFTRNEMEFVERRIELENKCKELMDKIEEVKSTSKEVLRSVESRQEIELEKSKDVISCMEGEIKRKNEEIEKNSELLDDMKLQLVKEKENYQNVIGEKERELEEQKCEIARLMSEVEKVEIDRPRAVDTQALGMNKEVLKVDGGGLCRRIADLEGKLLEAKKSFEEELTAERNRHRKEFERAARTREEKFQSELRFFLQEREDKVRRDLGVVRDEEVGRAVLEYKTRWEEEKRKITDEWNERLKAAVEERKGREGISSDEKEKEISDLRGRINEMQDEMRKLREEKEEELKTVTRKLTSEKDRLRENVKVQLSMGKETLEKQTEALKKREREIEQLKNEHVEMNRQIQQLNLKIERREKEIERLKNGREDKEKKNVTRKLFDDLFDEEDEEQVENRVRERIQEERRRWLQEAQEYIHGEIRIGVEENLKIEREKSEKGMKEAENLLKVQIENLESGKKELEEKLTNKVESLEEENRQMKENIKKERQKKHEEKEIEKQKESEKEKLIQERIEKEVDSEVKVKLEEEVAILRKKFVTELEARVVREKSSLEKDVRSWKDEMKKKFDGQKEKLQNELRMRVEKEKKRLEEDTQQKKEADLQEMRSEFESQMRKRIQEERKEWEDEEVKRERRKKRRDQDDSEERLKEKLKSETDEKNKACQERDRALEWVRSREEGHRTERDRLKEGLTGCRTLLEEMRREHSSLEERYTQMDRKYKEDMLEARRKREELEQKLREGKTYREQRKDSEGQRFRSGPDLLGDTWQTMAEEKLTEAPEAETILELRDHYLHTVAKIKADVTSHISEANSRAASTLRAEIKKQRIKLIETFAVKCKALLKTELTGKVSDQCLNSLYSAVEGLCYKLLHTSSLLASGSTHRSDQMPLEDTHKYGQTDSPRSLIDTRRSTGRIPNKSHNNAPTKESKVPATRHYASKEVRREEFVRVDEERLMRRRADEQEEQRVERKFRQDAEKFNSSQNLPQLERVALFDCETPVNSRSPVSSPGSPAPINPLPKLKDTAELSPREDRKVTEARVRLARWADSGEAPWKSSVAASPLATAVKRATSWDRRNKRSDEVQERQERYQVPKLDLQQNRPTKLGFESGLSDDMSGSGSSDGGFVTLEPENSETWTQFSQSERKPSVRSRSLDRGALKDFDRIKAAMLGPRNSDTESDGDSMTFAPPISTPIKSKSLQPNQDEEMWKTLQPQTEVQRDSWQVPKSAPPVRAQSRLGKRGGGGKDDQFVLKSAEFNLPSEPIARGNSPYKYRSLEDLLDNDRAGTPPVQPIKRSAPPVKAMTEDFWLAGNASSDASDWLTGELRSKQKPDAVWNAGGKMSRSVSEQSLHMLHSQAEDRKYMSPFTFNDDDNLGGSYLAQSHFDLRPFANEEQF